MLQACHELPKRLDRRVGWLFARARLGPGEDLLVGDQLVLVIIDTELPYLAVDLQEEVIDGPCDEGTSLAH